MHQLKILHAVCCRLLRCVSDGFTRVVQGGEIEFIEGCEEVIMPGLVAPFPVAHRPGIDQGVVKLLVVIAAANGRLPGGRVTRVITWSWKQLGTRPVNAKPFFGREADPTLRVNRSPKMIV